MRVAICVLCFCAVWGFQKFNAEGRLHGPSEIRESIEGYQPTIYKSDQTLKKIKKTINNVKRMSQKQKRRKVWKFAFSLDGFPANFINETTGKLEGQSVDMVKKICQLARKKCVVDWVPRADCWNDATLKSQVLDNRTFDVCANLVESPDRNVNYRFPEQSIYRIPNPQLIRAPGNTQVNVDALKQCNDFIMAFPALTALNRDCLITAGLFVKETNMLPIEASGSIVAAQSQIAQAVIDGTADVGLVIPRLLFRNDVDRFAESACLNVLIGLNMMVNQDDPVAQEFINWWEPTLKRFICLKNKRNRPNKYQEFCQQMRQNYRDTDPLCFTPGVDAACPGKPIPPKPTGPGPIDPCTGQ